MYAVERTQAGGYLAYIDAYHQTGVSPRPRSKESCLDMLQRRQVNAGVVLRFRSGIFARPSSTESKILRDRCVRSTSVYCKAILACVHDRH